MINYEKVITVEDLNKLGKEKIEFIKQKSQEIKDRYDYNIHIKVTHNKAQTQYSNQAPLYRIANDEVNKKEYDNESIIFKSILKSNIIFPDFNKLFNILLENNVSFKILLSISNRITTMKLLNNLNERINNLSKYNKEQTEKEINDIFKTLLEKGVLNELPKSKSLEQKLEIIKIIINKLSETTVADKNLITILKKLSHYYLTDEYESIVNILIQIVTFEKESYKELEKSKVKKLK